MAASTQNYWRTERIRLRAYNEADVERLTAQINDRDNHLDWLYDRIPLPQTPEQVKTDFALHTLPIKPPDDDQCLLAVETAAGEFAGQLHVWLTSRPLYFVFGIYVLPGFQGQGLGREALTVLLDYYFNEKGYRKAEAHVFGYNTVSQAFHADFGFTFEGTLRGRVFSRGQHHDLHISGLLADEFNARYDHNAWRK